MPNAEIITIGTEILLGEIVDTNTHYIARSLRANGIDIYRTTSVGDNVERIALSIQEAVKRAEIVLTTGGLGPTVDDPTREAVARAFDVELKFHQELWEQVIERFSRFDRYPTENNRRQAFLPEGAIPIENPVGTAPAFRMDTDRGTLISLPGVPREMEHLLENDVLPYLKKRFEIESTLVVRILHTAGIGESQIDEHIGDLEKLTNPTVGLAAHSSQVDIRITAKAKDTLEANSLIQEVEKEIQSRLGTWIYGVDEETLEEKAMRSLQARQWNLVILEAGLHGKLVRRFAVPPLPAASAPLFLRGEVIPRPPQDPQSFPTLVASYRQKHSADVGLGVALYPAEKKSEIFLSLISPDDERTLRVPFGGPPKLAHRRAINLGLDLLRKL